MFQSSSGLSTGCNVSTGRGIVQFGGFNPHPAFRPDATRPTLGRKRTTCFVSILIRPFDRMQPSRSVYRVGQGIGVSILIRPFDRMQPLTNAVTQIQNESFNPHPAFRPDATVPQAYIRFFAMFQSSSGLSTGCNATESVWRTNYPKLFQSSSGLSTGCNGDIHQSGGDRLRVSILIRPFDRMQHIFITGANSGNSGFQSSSGLSTGCNDARRGCHHL